MPAYLRINGQQGEDVSSLIDAALEEIEIEDQATGEVGKIEVHNGRLRFVPNP